MHADGAGPWRKPTVLNHSGFAGDAAKWVGPGLGWVASPGVAARWVGRVLVGSLRRCCGEVGRAGLDWVASPGVAATWAGLGSEARVGGLLLRFLREAVVP